MKKLLIFLLLVIIGYVYLESAVFVPQQLPAPLIVPNSTQLLVSTSTAQSKPTVIPKVVSPAPKKETPQPAPVVTLPPVQPTVALSTSNEAPVVSVAGLEMRIHELINKERVAQGLTALVWQPGLLSVARAHSADMAARGYFAHNSPEGEDFSARYKRGGFDCQVRVGNTIYLGAENLYQNNRYDSWHEINGVRTYDWNSLEEIAMSTVAGWMASPGHRQNILTPFWQSESIGVAFATNDQILITQNFC